MICIPSWKHISSPSTEILSQYFYICIKAWNFSIKFRKWSKIQNNQFYTPFLKIRSIVHSQILISRYCILIAKIDTPEAYLKPFQTSKSELFAEIVNVWWLFVIVAKSYILAVWHYSEYASTWYEVEGYIGLTLVTQLFLNYP